MFSLFGPTIKNIMNYTQEQINLVSTLENMGT